MLTITKKKDGDALVVYLQGRLETTTAPQFSAELKDALDGVVSLTLDMEKLDYISSAGLRVLLTVQKRMNVQGTMKILHINETVQEIFEITGFSEIFTVE